MGGANGWTGPLLLLIAVAFFVYKKYLIRGLTDKLKDAVKHFKDRK